METKRQIYVKHIKNALEQNELNEKELSIVQYVVFGLLPTEEEINRRLELMKELMEFEIKGGDKE